jgi:hypothetical protein
MAIVKKAFLIEITHDDSYDEDGNEDMPSKSTIWQEMTWQNGNARHPSWVKIDIKELEYTEPQIILPNGRTI